MSDDDAREKKVAHLTLTERRGRLTTNKDYFDAKCDYTTCGYRGLPRFCTNSAMIHKSMIDKIEPCMRHTSADESFWKPVGEETKDGKTIRKYELTV